MHDYPAVEEELSSACVGNRAEIRSSFITTTVREESQVTRMFIQPERVFV